MTTPERPTPGQAALPFTLRRSSSVVGEEITSTSEVVHGLLRFGEAGLAIQWRVSRSTDRVGNEIRRDHEIDPVREVVVPVGAIAGAAVRWFWRRWPPGRYLVITATDLRAFEELAGISGLRLDHPAQLLVRLRSNELAPAREFAGEVEMAAADRAIREAEGPPRLQSHDRA